MNRPTDSRGPAGSSWGSEELAALDRSGRQGPLDRPTAEESQRATQPLPAQRTAEAGEAVVTTPSTARPADLTAARPESGGDFLADSDREQLRQRWLHMQSGFVDSPRQTVEEADRLIGDVLERVTRGLTVEREGLAARWRGGSGNPDTEDLRLAIQGYRALFERLLGT